MSGAPIKLCAKQSHGSDDIMLPATPQFWMYNAYQQHESLFDLVPGLFSS
jgi:hypothetical protein